MNFLGAPGAKAMGTATSIATTARTQLLRPCAMGFDLIVVAANLTSSIAFGNQLCPSTILCHAKMLCRTAETDLIGIRYLYLAKSAGAAVPQIPPRSHKATFGQPGPVRASVGSSEFVVV